MRREHTIEPLPGFDWSKVKWGGPNERISEHCSYCGEQLGLDDVPLMMWSEAGACAQFCDACMVRYWGFAPTREPDD